MGPSMSDDIRSLNRFKNSSPFTCPLHLLVFLVRLHFTQSMHAFLIYFQNPTMRNVPRRVFSICFIPGWMSSLCAIVRKCIASSLGIQNLLSDVIHSLFPFIFSWGLFSGTLFALPCIFWISLRSKTCTFGDSTRLYSLESVSAFVFKFPSIKRIFSCIQASVASNVECFW